MIIHSAAIAVRIGRIPDCLFTRIWILPTAVVFAATLPLRGQTHVMAGPADPLAIPAWEQAFAEGPFDLPDLQADAGGIDFTISSSDSLARAAFNRGLAALHRLDDREAERCFRLVVKRDPECAIGYAGLALANDAWPGRAALFVRKARDRRASASTIEAAFIDALAEYYSDLKADVQARSKTFIAALEKLSAEHRENPGIRALLVRWLISSRDNAGPEVSSPVAVEAMIESIRSADPKHPAAVYAIPLWMPAQPERALPVLAICPATPKALLAGGDVLERLGKFSRAAEWFTSAADVAGARHPHDMEEWRLREVALDRRITALASAGQSQPVFDAAADRPLAALDGLLRIEKWSRVLELPSPAESAPIDQRGAFAHAQGMAAFASGQRERAWRSLAELQQIVAASTNRTTPAPLDVQRRLAEWESELQVRNLLDRISPDDAVGRLRGARSIPALRLSRMYQSAGRHDEACQWAAQALSEYPHALPETANFIAVHFSAKKSDEAFRVFTQSFRRLCADADPDLPCLEHLNAAAAAMQLPKNWALTTPPPAAEPAIPPPPPVKTVAAGLPGTGSLADWSLPDARNELRTPGSFRGRPTVFLFFLGASCTHCMRQLNTFAPLHPRFEAAGGQIVAVSIDPVDRVARTFMGFEPEKSRQPFPFLILADPELAAFRAWDVYDEFTGAPIHGTFIVDASGRLRWRHLGTEPFMMALEVLREVEQLRHTSTK